MVECWTINTATHSSKRVTVHSEIIHFLTSTAVLIPQTHKILAKTANQLWFNQLHPLAEKQLLAAQAQLIIRSFTMDEQH